MLYVVQMETTKLKRPPSVWMTPIVLTLISLFLVAVVLYNVVDLLRYSGRQLKWYELRPLFLSFVAAVVVVIPSILAFVGLLLRKPFGRWLGGIVLFFVAATCWLVMLGHILNSLSIRDAIEVLGALVRLFVLLAVAIPLSVLFARLMFAQKVRQFFDRNATAN